MGLTRIEVEAVTDTGGDTLPRRLRVRAEWICVQEILDRWYQVREEPEWPAANYYKVLGTDQRVYLLKHELESGAWYLVREW